MDISKLHSALFSWWREYGRVLEWRQKAVVSSKYQVVREKWDSAMSSSTRQIEPGFQPRDNSRASGIQVFSPDLEDSSSLSVRESTFDSYFSTETFRDPYRVVVAEVMLQQTQVDRVKVKYEEWMKKWPTIEDLAKATLSEVIIEWKGLGYNRRARFLWLLAGEIVKRKQLACGQSTAATEESQYKVDNHRQSISTLSDFPSEYCSRGRLTARVDPMTGWPTTEKEVLKLPGIGRYTARAIMSFAFGQQVGVVDVNVKRVFGRLFENWKTCPELVEGLKIGNSNEGILISNFKEPDWFQLADDVLPISLADPWNQALMDFGALICTAKAPKCEVCPISDFCEANMEAIDEGYKNFAEKFNKKTVDPMPTLKDSKDVVNNKKLPFEQTDRFLRGRIVDELREQSVIEKELTQTLNNKFPQFEKVRIVKQLYQLQKEQMIRLEDGIWRI